MLCTIGDLVEDIVVWPSAPPQRGTDTIARVFRRRGGSAANVAIMAARAGQPSRFIGQVGDDYLGAALVSEMTEAGVDVVTRVAGRTGTIIVLVEPDGERTMLPDRGAATLLDSLPNNALDGVTWLHVPAYSLVIEPLAATAISLIATARNEGVPVSVDASSTGLIREFGTAVFAAQLARLQPQVLFCNQDEAELLDAGRNRPFPGTDLTVIKAGPQPVLLIEPTGASAEVPVPRVGDVNDTTGAGDAFAAGFLLATMAGVAPPQATARAIQLAATVLLRPGAGGQDN